MVGNAISAKEGRMLNRDFSQSNKVYFKQNKILLITLAVVLLVGIVIGAIFGMNGNFEIAGYHEFSVRIGADTAKYDEYISTIESAVNSQGGDFDTVSVFGEGDDTRFMVRYMDTLTADEQNAVNEMIIEKLSLTDLDISAHSSVAPVVRNLDYLYTALSIILVLILASIFAKFRYNTASALTTLILCIIGTLLYMSIGAILRLEIGLSYFAMLVIVNVLLIYTSFIVFENIRENNLLQTDEYAHALESGMKASHLRICVLNIAIMLLGLVFVIFAPNDLKYIALNIMFMPVAVLAMCLYVLPFVWSVLITLFKKREVKVKADKDKEDNSNLTVQNKD